MVFCLEFLLLLLIFHQHKVKLISMQADEDPYRAHLSCFVPVNHCMVTEEEVVRQTVAEKQEQPPSAAATETPLVMWPQAETVPN